LTSPSDCSAEPMTIGENCRRETMELHPARSP
jgi:hypothetical protein